MEIDRGTKSFRRGLVFKDVPEARGGTETQQFRNTAVFQRIIANEIAHDRIYEDDHALAYYDLAAGDAKSQVVVIPKGAPRSFAAFSAEASDAEVAGFWRAVGAVVRKLGLHAGAYRVLMDQRVPGGKELPSFHLLLSRDASFVTHREAPIAEELTLFLKPPEDEPTPERIELLSDELGLDAYQAGQHLRSAVPRVLRRGALYELEELTAKLESAGIPVCTVETQVLIDSLKPWLVTKIETDGEHLVLVSHEEERKVKLDGRRDALLLIGRYTVSAKKKDLVVATPNKRRAGLSTGRLSRSQHTIPFAHLYFWDDPRPFVFVESKIHNYDFLGETMAPSANLNFKLLEERLASIPKVTKNEDLLVSKPERTSTDAMWRNLKRPTTPTPDTDLDTLSRLIFQTWAATTLSDSASDDYDRPPTNEPPVVVPVDEPGVEEPAAEEPAAESPPGENQAEQAL